MRKIIDITTGEISYAEDDPAEVTPEVHLVPDLSFAQLLIGLVAEGWITEDEGNGWLEGRLPNQVRALINALPPTERFVARAMATRPSTVERNYQLVQALGVQQGKTPEDLDAFFMKYSQV